MNWCTGLTAQWLSVFRNTSSDWQLSARLWRNGIGKQFTPALFQLLQMWWFLRCAWMRSWFRILGCCTGMRNNPRIICSREIGNKWIGLHNNGHDIAQAPANHPLAESYRFRKHSALHALVQARAFDGQNSHDFININELIADLQSSMQRLIGWRGEQGSVQNEFDFLHFHDSKCSTWKYINAIRKWR